MDKKSLMRRMIWAAVMAAALFLVLMYAVGYRVDSLAWTQEIYRYNALLKKFCIASAVGAAVMFIIYTGFGKYKVSLLICACILVINLGMLGYAWAIQPEWEKIAIEQMQELEQEEKIHRTNIRSVDWNELLTNQRKDVYQLLYVGREDCPNCMRFEKMLQDSLEHKNINVLYYSTLEDRNKKDFDQKMKSLGIMNVPCLEVVGHNAVKKLDEEDLYSDQEVLDNQLDELKSVFDW